MTTTYDPHHPQYLDDADLREELTRVFDLCQGCRLCSSYCSAFPSLFEMVDRHENYGVFKIVLAESESAAAPGAKILLQGK